MAKYKIIPSSRTIVRSPISIGHKAEKGVEAIEFDLTAWVETYGSGTLTVIMRRWGDAIPYPIALEIDENNKATWTLSDMDTAKAGMAYAQLNYIVGDEVVKKSDIYTFRVMDSLTGEGEPPEAYESWLEHLTHLAAEAMAEVLDIEGIVTDKTLTVDGGIADAKATGDALALKADKSTTYTKTEVDQMIEDVEVETDTTLSVSGRPADAKATGDALSALEDAVTEETDKLKADLDDVNDSLTSRRSGTLVLNPMAYYRHTQDGVTAVDFSTMPLNTYIWGQFSVVKSALINANFPLSWSDTDYIHMVRLAAGNSIGIAADVSIIRVFNFTKIQSAEMLYYATSSGNKYRWLLPTNDLTKQYFPADAKAVGDALALKANITDLRNGLILTNAVGAIVSVAETYFDVGYANGTNLVYQQKHSTGLMAYNPYYVYDGQTWGTNEDYEGKPCIHCAQFVMALLKGIRYQDSRYVTGIQGKNKISQWAWSPDHLYPINYGGTQWANFSEGPTDKYTDGYMDLKAMADYAHSHGLLRSMEEHDINVSPGDLIFEGTDVESISDLGHVSIALHVGMESKNVQIVEAWNSIKYDGSGVGVRTRTVSFSDIDYYASLPLKTSSYAYEIICNIETQKSIQSQHETSMNVYRLNNISFRPGFYTFVMQADVIGETNPYVTYKLPGSTWFPLQYFVNSSGNYIATVYISSELVDNEVQINVPANVGIDANKLIVVKGYINTDINLIKT